jgi:2-polyprenyl-6-methoxyphenol hydroxylase-like FAD-dependent oxidoreductase
VRTYFRMDCIIIGGGIGGLTAALALRERGVDAHVYEAAPELREVGAGIWMPANAMQVLDRLGVAAAVAAAGRPIDHAEVHDRHAGRLQSVEMKAIVQRYGVGTISLHRGRLQQILASRLPASSIHTGHAFTSFDATDGSGVQVRFSGGQVARASVLIGADGIRSTVRSQLFPGSALRYSGQTSHRGIASGSLPSDLSGHGRETWDDGCRFGFSEISDTEVYWFAVQDAHAGGSDMTDVLPTLQARFADFPIAKELLARTRPEAVTRTDIWDLRPLRAWWRDSVVLLGDAAHATTPNLGQGAAQAIEDGWVLADRLATHGATTTALAEYEALRKPKADHVVRTSWWLGKVAHIRNPVGRALRNALLRATPPRITERQFHTLFNLEY